MKKQKKSAQIFADKDSTIPHETKRQNPHDRGLISEDDQAFNDFLKARSSATQCSREVLQKIRAKIRVAGS